MDEIIEHVESWGGVLTLRPGPGDGTPEVAWGDVFLYYAPDGTLPAAGQPFATVVTHDYPGEPSSGLDAPGAFRVNVDAGRRGDGPPDDPTVRDRVMPHPVYAAAGWVCVVEPGEHSDAELRSLLQAAHAGAARRWHRRHG